MRLFDIFNQRIITQNCDLEDSLKPEIFESLAIHNDRLPFNYERLFVSGRLRDFLNDPKSVKFIDIQFRERKDGGHYDGLQLMKGADYILPLVFLHNALMVRLVKDAEETEVVIWPGIRGDVVTDKMELWEADGYIEDIKSIYNLHFELTRKYYALHIERLSDEDCLKLLKEIEGIEFTASFLK